VLHYLGVLNLVLAAFNMAPAFPLDGGRVARAAIWAWTQDSIKATRIAARMGEIGAWILMAFGGLGALTGVGATALWWIVLVPAF
jgi:Zn-dependent protease